MLNIREEEYPEKYRPLIRRLQSAILEPEMRKQMEIEDGILDDFEDMQRLILNLRQNAVEVKREAGEKIAEAEREIGVAKQEIAEVKREAGEKIAEAEREASNAKLEVARNLKAAGVPIETIMQATGLSREEIKAHIQKELEDSGVK